MSGLRVFVVGKIELTQMSLPLECTGVSQSFCIKDLKYHGKTNWGEYCFLSEFH